MSGCESCILALCLALRSVVGDGDQACAMVTTQDLDLDDQGSSFKLGFFPMALGKSCGLSEP